jgi:tripartite-type tricarboxylate transporter receptor subunit TctC
VHRLITRSLAAIALVLAASSAQAQGTKFPERTIRIVVPFAAGGGVDALARLLAEKMQPKLGVTIIVDNRPGANGTIGGLNVMQSPPDGHTVLFSASTHTMSHQVMAKVPYHPVNDFTAIARIGEAPMLVIMAPNMPQKNLGEAAADMRQNPERWVAATAALGSPGHIAAIMLGQLAKANLTITPYRGTAPALNDVAGGHVQLLVDAIVALLPLARDGKVKALAITTPKRSPLAPEIPTAAESGLPGLEWVSWYGVWGPKGLPADVTAKLNAAFAEAARELAQSGRLADLGVTTVEETPEQFKSFVDGQLKRSEELLKAANFKPE